MTLLEARNKLNMTQAQAAEASGIKPKAISLMEQGKTPPDPQYVRWLGRAVMSRYKRVQDMPTHVLAQAIKNRESYDPN